MPLLRIATSLFNSLAGNRLSHPTISAFGYRGANHWMAIQALSEFIRHVWLTQTHFLRHMHGKFSSLITIIVNHSPIPLTARFTPRVFCSSYHDPALVSPIYDPWRCRQFTHRIIFVYFYFVPFRSRAFFATVHQTHIRTSVRRNWTIWTQTSLQLTTRELKIQCLGGLYWLLHLFGL